MSSALSIGDIYVNRVVRKLSNVNESVPPMEAGEYSPEEAAPALKTHAQKTAKIGGADVMKRFYLTYIKQLSNITDDTSVLFAIDALNNVLQSLKDYDGGVYPGATKDFEIEIVQPAVSAALAQAGQTTGKANVGYISRAVTDAAVESGVLKETGATRRAATSGASKGAAPKTAEEVAKMFGGKSSTKPAPSAAPKPADEIGDIA